MIGLAVGNLFTGPISDSIGRKQPLMIAMLLFTLASLGIIFVNNIWWMIILRFVQGFVEAQAQLFLEQYQAIYTVVNN